jgi:hypothetical protein
MPDNQGQESFDFSKPFVQTVEVEAKPKSVDTDSSLHERFEAAKHGTPVDEAVTQSRHYYNKHDPRTDRRKNRHVSASAGQWLVTFVLLGSLCAVSIFALINYKQNQITLADVSRQVQVAGIKSSQLNRIVGKNFTIEHNTSTPKDLVVTDATLQTLVGFDRQLLVQKVTTNSSGKISGVIVFSQEQIEKQTDEVLITRLKKLYSESNYQYPLVQSSTIWKKLTPQAGAVQLPVLYVAQTLSQIYIVEQYNQIPGLTSLADELISGMQLN